MNALRFLVLLALAFPCSCSGPEDEQRRDLAAARAAWTSHGINTYDVLETKSCFCPPPRQWMTHVRDGRVESVSLLDDPEIWDGDTEAALDRALQDARTVEDGFAAIERAIGRVASLEVTYDGTLGFPTFISIDQIADAVDDETVRTMGSLSVPDLDGR